MSISIRSLRHVRRRSVMRAAWAALRQALGWPLRAYRARQLMLRLGAFDDRELRDIGLTRQDLRDVTGLAFDADPSLTLRRRVEARRKRR